MHKIHNQHTKKFPEALKDIIVTEKSLGQEQGNGSYNQISIITDGYMTKPDVRQSLLEWVPGLELGNIQVITLSKKQCSKNDHHYRFKIGSNRSALKGAKKFIITIYNYGLMAEVFKKAMEYINV